MTEIPYSGEGDRNYNLWLDVQKSLRTLISEVKLSANGVLTFGGIPQTFTHLELELLVDSTRTGAGSNTGMRIWCNNDRTAVYHINGRLNVAGVAPSDITNINDSWGYLGQFPAAQVGAGTPHAESMIHLPFYARKDTIAKALHVKSICGVTAGGSQFDGSCLFFGGSAVNGITRIDVSDDFTNSVRNGSVGRLYGVN